MSTGYSSWAFLKKMYNVILKFRLRHLRLGPENLIRLLVWHLKPVRLDQTAKKNVGWIQNFPTITILLTVYNQSKDELTRSLHSARIQSGTSISILILDDGSTNSETLDFLDSIELRINEKIFREENVGVVAARNFLIARTFTDFLIFLDPDDSLSGNLVFEAVKVLTQFRELEILFTDVLIHDTLNNEFELWNTGPFNVETLARVNTIPMSSIISTRLMKGLGGFSSDFQ
jgi:glycosyltransferase involved in cell wall biosynthesis